MKRNKLLRRKRWMKQRRGKRRGDPNPPAFAFPKPRGRAYDDEYRAAVLAERCLLTDVPDHVCDSRTTGDHDSSPAKGRKADDGTMIPLCRSAHRERQTATGWCAGVHAPAMRMIMLTAAVETQARVAMRRAA